MFFLEKPKTRISADLLKDSNLLTWFSDSITCAASLRMVLGYSVVSDQVIFFRVFEPTKCYYCILLYFYDSVVITR